MDSSASSVIAPKPTNFHKTENPLGDVHKYFSPYGSPYGSSYGSPYGSSYGSPYGSSYGSPYGGMTAGYGGYPSTYGYGGTGCVGAIFLLPVFCKPKRAVK